MSNQLQKICVFIHDEKQLQEARGLLERYGQKIFEDCFELDKDGDTSFNYLNLNNSKTEQEWFIGLHFYNRKITLTELETLLKDEN